MFIVIAVALFVSLFLFALAVLLLVSAIYNRGYTDAQEDSTRQLCAMVNEIRPLGHVDAQREMARRRMQ